MLFHVTATHSPDDCPGYNREDMPQIIAAIENAENVAKELGVKIHFLVNGAPEHVVFLLLEADSPASIAMFANSFPLKQDFDVTAVVHEKDMVAMAKEMMGRG